MSHQIGKKKPSRESSCVPRGESAASPVSPRIASLNPIPRVPNRGSGQWWPGARIENVVCCVCDAVGLSMPAGSRGRDGEIELVLCEILEGSLIVMRRRRARVSGRATRLAPDTRRKTTRHAVKDTRTWNQTHRWPARRPGWGSSPSGSCRGSRTQTRLRGRLSPGPGGCGRGRCRWSCRYVSEKNERRSRRERERVEGRRFRAAAGRDGRVAGGRCERVLLSFGTFWRVRSFFLPNPGVITQEQCLDADVGTRYYNHEQHFLDVEVVCERGEEGESQKRCRIPKRETSSDFTAAVRCFNRRFGRICVFVICVMVRFSVVTSQSPNVLPRPKTKKAMKREKNRRR